MILRMILAHKAQIERSKLPQGVQRLAINTILAPQNNTDRMPGVGTSSRSPTLMAGDLEHDPATRQNKSECLLWSQAVYQGLVTSSMILACQTGQIEQVVWSTSGRSPTPSL